MSMLVVYVSSSPHACNDAGLTPFLAASHDITATSSASAFVALAAGVVGIATWALRGWSSEALRHRGKYLGGVVIDAMRLVYGMSP